MKSRWLTLLAMAGLLFIAAPYAGAEEENPTLANDPVYIVQTLMNNNYMNIRALYVPIINYGGGEKEFYRILDSYSLAVTLYLHRKMPESAEMFRKNAAEIKELAARIAKKYREDSEKIHTETVKMYIRSKMQLALKSRTVETEITMFTTGDVNISNASDSIRMADRYMENGRPLDAIAYYRKSKAYCFAAFDNYHVPLADSFRMDIADNSNVIYTEQDKAKTCVNC
ncbi:MAG: hypothetical protein EPN93_08830 [Spirochaetes bacterium]|nr:MAG: hypothetical protein EPN93_08830 [Spirochaetota bacterium]